MDFTLPDEHVRLKDAARKLFAERLPPERLAEIADAPDARDAVDAALWDEVVKMGWVGMATDLTGDFSYEAVLLEEAGYALAPIPMLSTTVAMPAAIAMADSGRDTATVAWAEPGGAEAFGPAEQVRMPAIEHDRADRLGGRKVGVPDMQLVKKIVVLARTDAGDSTVPAACVVDVETAAETDSVQVTYLPTLDGTRRVAQVDFVAAPSLALLEWDDPIAAMRRRLLAGISAESVGVAQRALDLAVEHATSREQFGRPIGTYQAISHRIADVYVAVELARSLAYRAAWYVSTLEDGHTVRGRKIPTADVDLACAQAKAVSGDAAVQACETVIQVLGGMGMTWEHIAHRLYKRALANRAYGGSPAHHRAVIAATLLDD